MNKFQLKHKELIELSGGVTTDIFVEKVGVLITKKSSVTDKASILFSKLNIDDEAPDAMRHAEFNSRLTYLSFPDNSSSSEDYNKRIIQDFGHRSIYNDEHVTFLIAGASIETMIEFIAHNEASVARLTSSKTKSQNDTLYRIQTKNMSEKFIELQKKFVKDYVLLRSSMNFDNKTSQENEIFNILNLGNKAVSFTVTMSIKDWHKTLIGRLSNHGVESEMIEIMTDVCNQLKAEYPYFFNAADEYFSFCNSDKYKEN